MGLSLQLHTTTIAIHNIMMITITVYTSSTAQSGGGSFQNSKPIGELGCCESRMAKQKH